MLLSLIFNNLDKIKKKIYQIKNYYNNLLKKKISKVTFQIAKIT